MVQLNERVCIKGTIRTNKYANTNFELNDVKDEILYNACGKIVSIYPPYFTVQLDNGRFAVEVSDDNIVNVANVPMPSSLICGNPAIRLGAVICVLGLVNIKSSPFSSVNTQKFFNKVCGEIVSYRESNGDYYFTVKFNDNTYGSDITCSQFTNFSNEEYTKQRINEVLAHQILYQQMNNENSNLGNNNNDIYINSINGNNKILPLVKLEPTNHNTLIYSSDDLNKLNDNYDIKGNYSQLNNDEKFQKEVIKYFRDEILNDWLFDELKSLLGYFKVNDGKVSLIDSLDNNDNSNNDDSVKNINLKIEFIKENFLTKKIIKHVIKKFIKENNVNWYDLKHSKKKLVRKFLFYFDEQLRKAVKRGRF